ncbi:MAG: SMP-30/gluconolactonase/LRE family protein [Myxococcota bacterium]
MSSPQTNRRLAFRRPVVAWLAAIGALVGSGCRSAPPPGTIVACDPKGPARPVCGFHNPEDIVALPGDEALILGEYGQSAADHRGQLVLFVLATEERRSLFRGGEAPGGAKPGWGDPTCTEPPTRDFNAHGIDLVRRDDGRLQLLVVQHGGREAIESFEIEGAGADWRATWRGCVPAPPDASLNEVVGLPDGRLYTTKMASLSGALDFEHGMPTQPTGHAFAWSPTEGFRKIEGTEGIMPNGIEASPDGRFVYMNASGDGSIRKVEVATGRELGRAPVPSPDNVTWAPDGRRLLVASLAGLDPNDFAGCTTLVRGACTIPFAIVAVDAETMQTLGPVYESQGAPMGAGTVGLQVGQELFVGSFKGDRILRVALDADGQAR